MKVYGKTINVDFHDNSLTLKRSHWIWFSVILIESVFKINTNYFSKAFLEEYKYQVKRRTKEM